MRLIKCYVESFGTLHGFECRFDPALTCVKSPNGSGKSTLVAFIKAMLYGMPDTRKQGLDENDRKRYQPWQGGRYGGSLTFSHGGKSYTVERSFGRRPSEDEYTLRYADTGSICKDFSEVPGEDIFKLDIKGFERTLMTSEKNLHPSSDSRSIASRLSELMGSDGDIGSYDGALKILDDMRRRYQKKGGGGEIAEARSRLEDTQRRLRELKELRDSAEGLSQRIASMTKRQGELLKKRESIRERLVADDSSSQIRIHTEHLEKLKEKLREEQAALERENAFFGSEIPTAQQINEAMAEWHARKNSCASAPSEERLEELKDIFEAAPTNNRELKRVDEEIQKLFTLEEILYKVNAKTDGSYEEERRLFPNGVPEEISGGKLPKFKRSSRGLTITLGIGLISAALLAIGGYLVTPILYGVGAIFAIGAIGAAIAGRRGRSASALAREAGLGQLNDGDAAMELSDRLDKLLKIRADRDIIKEKTELEIKELRESIAAFIKRYPSLPKLPYADSLRLIRKGYREYRLFVLGCGEGEEATPRLDELLRRYPSLSREDPFRELTQRLSRRSVHMATVERLEGEIGEYAERIARLGNGGTDSREELKSFSEGVEAELAQLQKGIALAEREYNGDMERCEAIDELESECLELREALESYSDRLRIIQMTEDFLGRACETVQSKYLGITKERFIYYEGLIGKGGEFSLDTELHLTKAERGAMREEESFSRGTKDLYSLSLRLSLCDALFEGDLPFLILDDPFTALDDERTGAAIKLLKSMSAQRQIIYFTCSSSRAF